MKLSVVFLLIIFLYSNGFTQEKSAIQLANERFPMLKVCEQAGEEMLCGRLEVFENREMSKGRKISIDVIVAPSFEVKPPKIAFLYHLGGPGGSNKFMSCYFSKRGKSKKF
jgi:hypothetical protein